jgi:hypothetical protein
MNILDFGGILMPVIRKSADLRNSIGLCIAEEIG